MLKELDEEIIVSIINKYGLDIKKINLSNNGLQSIKNIEKISKVLQILNLANNELSNIYPLSHLTLLTELDLSSNHIYSIESLNALKNLKVLNLQGNRLSTVRSIACISNLTDLRSLYLAGNPIAINDTDYPANVFKIQGNLQHIDDWTRDKVMESMQNFVFSAIPNQEPNDVLIKATQENTNQHSTIQHRTSSEAAAIVAPIEVNLSEEEYKNQIISLKVQVDAMNIAFNLQEKTIASNINLSKYQNNIGTISFKAEETKTLESFPYYRLLQLWRKQALDCIVARTFSDKRLEVMTLDIKKERKDLLALAKQQEAQSLVWKQRSSALEEKCRMLTHLHSQTSQSLHENIELKQTLEEKLRDLQLKFQNVIIYMKSLQVAFNQSTLSQTMDIVKAAEKMQSFEKRIALATEKLTFTAAVIAHREVEVRNSIAAIDAEKRLLEWQRLQKNGNSACISLSSDDDRLVEVSSKDNINYISDLIIDPEVESMLRSIFRNLDPNDTGLVPLNLLMVCFIEEYSHAERNNLLDVSIPHLTPLGNLVSKSLGENRFLSLLRSFNNMPSDHNLTWGEFLLELVPRNDHTIRSSLTVNELNDLRNANLIHDFNWGVVPLVLPTDVNILSSMKDNCSERELRLMKERKYLQSKLQEMSRNLERRAEGIKSYFENELRREKLKEDRLNIQITQLKHSLIISENRLKENEILHQNLKEKYENQVNCLEEKNINLMNTITTSQQNLILKYESMLQDEISKSNRLEIEHNLAQRESSKKDVKCRAMQRDLLRIQSIQSTQTNEIIELKEKLALASSHNILNNNEHQRLIQENQQHWQDERQGYIQAISDLKSSLLEANQKLVVLNEELNKKNAVFATNNDIVIAAQESKSSELLHTEEKDMHEHSRLSNSEVQPVINVEEALRLEMDLFRKEFKNSIKGNSSSDNNQYYHSLLSSSSNRLIEMNEKNISPSNDIHNTVTTIPMTQQSAMAAHLSKLVRLAEQAISNSNSVSHHKEG